MLKSSGYSVSSFRIQKFSLSISHWLRVYLDFYIFVNWFIMLNFTWLLKLWPSCSKYLEINQSYIKASFCLTQNALHQIYNVAAGMKKVIVLLYLHATKWPYICQTYGAFASFYCFCFLFVSLFVCFFCYLAWFLFLGFNFA